MRSPGGEGQVRRSRSCVTGSACRGRGSLAGRSASTTRPPHRGRCGVDRHHRRCASAVAWDLRVPTGPCGVGVGDGYPCRAQACGTAHACCRGRGDHPPTSPRLHPTRPGRGVVGRSRGAQLDPDGPDQLWVADITQHPTRQGWVYVAVVIDAWSRLVVGHAIADHLRTELVVDALQTALWRRRPAPGVVDHSDHGTQAVHVLGVRATPPPRRPARLDGHRR